jgi:hypothetical protein
MTDAPAAPTKYALIKAETLRGERVYTVLIKMSDDFRRWPYREDYRRYATRKEAAAAAELTGAVLLRRWCDAVLTAAESAAQYGGQA